jgi:hypothetical protein
MVQFLPLELVPAWGKAWEGLGVPILGVPTLGVPILRELAIGVPIGSFL